MHRRFDTEGLRGVGGADRGSSLSPAIVAGIHRRDFGELDEVSLAYAVSIHKSRGSEFPAVVIPLAMQHFMLLRRNPIYTGITRGAEESVGDCGSQ
jgi:ATP-dependent exoDNAse (exonuclease V) alpha subunit